MFYDREDSMDAYYLELINKTKDSQRFGVCKHIYSAGGVWKSEDNLGIGLTSTLFEVGFMVILTLGVVIQPMSFWRVSCPCLLTPIKAESAPL